MDNEILYKKICKEHRDLTVRIKELEKRLNIIFGDYEETEKEKDFQVLSDSYYYIELSNRNSGKMYTILVMQYKLMIFYLATLEERMNLMNIDIIENDFSITYKFLGKTMPCKKEVK